MKNERNEKFKKRGSSIGEIHKKSVYDILFSASVHMEGLSAKEIHTRLKALQRKGLAAEGLTREKIEARLKTVSYKTVCNILNELLAEGKIFKSGKKYYIKSLFIDNGWTKFAEFLKSLQTLPFRLDKIQLSKIYSRGYTFSDELENMIFNFGNMIGAFIMYVLVESVRPNETVTAEDRDVILAKFLQDAIDMKSIFILFTKSLQGSPNRDLVDLNNELLGSPNPFLVGLNNGKLLNSLGSLLVGLNNELLDKMITAFNNVYPGFSETVDHSFKEYVSSFVPFESCDHDWRKINVHKIGDRYECRKCQGLAKEEDFEPVSS